MCARLVVYLLASCFASAYAQQPAARQVPVGRQVPAQQIPTPELKPLPDVPEPVAGDAIYAPLAVGNGPESLKIKLDSYLVVTFGPRAVVSPMISAGIRMAKPNYNYPNDWHQGMQGFARQYGSAFGTKAAYETGRFAAGALLHEDFRYRASQSAGFAARVGHAFGFAFVDRSDSGHARLAVANLAGAAAGGFVPNAWLPDGFNDWQHGGERMGEKMGGIVIQNVTREFAPEIFKAFHAIGLPFPRLPVPEWWTKDISVARP
jgi:hypothetical protein